MNKRGTEYVSITTMEYVFLIVLLIFLSITAYRGMDDQKLNQIKVEDLALAIESVFLLAEDLEVDYDFGEEKYVVEEENDVIKLYRNREEDSGKSLISKDKQEELIERVDGKTNKLNIKKERRRIIIS